MKWKERMCHRIINDSLTNEHEHTTYTSKTFVFFNLSVSCRVRPSLSSSIHSIQPNTIQLLTWIGKRNEREKFSETNQPESQREVREAERDKKERKRRSSMAFDWKVRKIIIVIGTCCRHPSHCHYLQSLSSLPIVDRNHFDRTQISFDRKCHSDYYVLCHRLLRLPLKRDNGTIDAEDLFMCCDCHSCERINAFFSLFTSNVFSAENLNENERSFLADCKWQHNQ